MTKQILYIGTKNYDALANGIKTAVLVPDDGEEFRVGDTLEFVEVTPEEVGQDRPPVQNPDRRRVRVAVTHIQSHED